MNESENQNNKYLCKKCGGYGSIKKEHSLIFYDWCDKCNGIGQVNFIENVLNTEKINKLEVPSKITHQIAKENIRIIINLLTEVCRDVGFYPEVTLKDITRYDKMDLYVTNTLYFKSLNGE